MLLRVTLVCKRAEHIGLSVAVDRETVSAREAAQMWGGHHRHAGRAGQTGGTAHHGLPPNLH